MTRNEAIGRLCKLQKEVADHLDNWSNAADCFCCDPSMGGRVADPSDYRNDGVALAWIEETVRARMGKVTPAVPGLAQTAAEMRALMPSARPVPVDRPIESLLEFMRERAASDTQTVGFARQGEFGRISDETIEELRRRGFKVSEEGRWVYVSWPKPEETKG